MGWGTLNPPCNNPGFQGLSTKRDSLFLEPGSCQDPRALQAGGTGITHVAGTPGTAPTPSRRTRSRRQRRSGTWKKTGVRDRTQLHATEWERRSSPAPPGDIPALDEGRTRAPSSPSAPTAAQTAQFTARPFPSVPQEGKRKEEKMFNCSWFLQGRWTRHSVTTPGPRAVKKLQDEGSASQPGEKLQFEYQIQLIFSY